MTRRQIENEIERVQGELAELRALLNEAHSRRKLRCGHGESGHGRGCGRLLPVATLTYYQTHWYTHPYGCTGGNYWTPGEGKFECPHCGAENRSCNRPEIVELKRFFKAVVKVY